MAKWRRRKVSGRLDASIVLPSDKTQNKQCLYGYGANFGEDYAPPVMLRYGSRTISGGRVIIVAAAMADMHYAFTILGAAG